MVSANDDDGKLGRSVALDRLDNRDRCPIKKVYARPIPNMSPEVVPLNLTPDEISTIHMALNSAVEKWRAHLKDNPKLQSQINAANSIKEKLIAVRESFIEPIDDAGTKQ